jgi:hypothetical protein
MRGRWSRPIVLVAAVVAEKDDVGEAVNLEAVRGGFQRLFEHVVRHGDRAGKAHVRGRRSVAALRHVGDDRRDDRVAEALGDALRQHLDACIVFAECDVGAALLGSADGDDDGGLARLNLVAQFGPGQVLKEYGFRGLSKSSLRGDEQNDGCESSS